MSIMFLFHFVIRSENFLLFKMFNIYNHKINSDLMSPDMILDELYPGDHGNDSPNLANHYELKRHG